MLLYCVGYTKEDGAVEAVTVGMEEWLLKTNEEPISEEIVLRSMRPFGQNKVAAFDVYIEEMKKKFPYGISYATEEELEAHVIRRKGYWENTGWK